mgnify:CR=1 FL=1
MCIRDSTSGVAEFNSFDLDGSARRDFVFEQYATEVFRIKSDGNISVPDGEIETKQDYPNIRPVLDFNFAATKKLKPEMTFARVGEASFHDGVGSVKFVSDNEPRFEHDIVTGECKGLLVEPAGTSG